MLVRPNPTVKLNAAVTWVALTFDVELQYTIVQK